MQFCILKNESEIICGPDYYHSVKFENILKDLGVDIVLPFENENVIIINSEYKIVPITHVDHIGYDGRIQYITPHYIVFENNEYHLHHDILNKDISDVRQEMKDTLATTRKSHEKQGTVVNIQNQSLIFPTIKEDRDIYLQALQLGMGDKTWKVDNTWITLSISELQVVVEALLTHYQSGYLIENSIVNQIDNSTTLSELALIDLNF